MSSDDLIKLTTAIKKRKDNEKVCYLDDFKNLPNGLMKEEWISMIEEAKTTAALSWFNKLSSKDQITFTTNVESAASQNVVDFLQWLEPTNWFSVHNMPQIGDTLFWQRVVMLARFGKISEDSQAIVMTKLEQYVQARQLPDAKYQAIESYDDVLKLYRVTRSDNLREAIFDALNRAEADAWADSEAGTAFLTSKGFQKQANTWVNVDLVEQHRVYQSTSNITANQLTRTRSVEGRIKENDYNYSSFDSKNDSLQESLLIDNRSSKTKEVELTSLSQDYQASR